MKIEMHAHTSEVSPCARVPAAKVVDAYVKAGYQAVTITDHFNSYVLEAFSGSPRERVTQYLEGFRRAQEAGEKAGLRIILGMESCIAGGREDFLVYGIDTDFIYANPTFYRYTQEEAYRACHEYGALLFQAHPCRPGLSPRTPKFLDGMEVYNGNPRHENNNPSARAWAEEHHLLFSSGSDYHETEDAARGGMIFPGEIHDSKELVAALAKGVGELIET